MLAAALLLLALSHRPAPRPVPVLEYHVIGTALPSSLAGLYVPPAEFRAQMSWLARHGWHAVTLDRVLASWQRGVPLPRKPVVLSFDDGYPGDWRYALPILRAHRFPGVLNFQIGNLAPVHVRALLRAGWQLASHTFTHPDLTTVGPAQLTREVSTSRRWLQRVFHVGIDTFCYPYGRYGATVVAAVRRAGYDVGETENLGWASPADGLLTLDRIRVLPTMGVAGLAPTLAAARGS